MPIDFPDLESIIRRAEMWKFRKMDEGESEAEYRIALADFVSDKDFIESEEIRNKVGWDKWNVKQNNRALLQRFLIRS